MTLDLEDLRRRMINHDVINDSAVVLVTAGEMYEILKALGYCPRCANKGRTEFGYVDGDGEVVQRAGRCDLLGESFHPASDDTP